MRKVLGWISGLKMHGPSAVLTVTTVDKPAKQTSPQLLKVTHTLSVQQVSQEACGYSM